MAELATAGSVVGLVSLVIQSCQGLTSYYSAWRSYDKEIGQIYQNVDELRITCENLERELQRIAEDQNPAVQQVVRLVTSCLDSMQNLHKALGQCRSTHIPDSLTAKFRLYRARAVYPFRKQTLQVLEDNVHRIQGNLSSALQILQLHISAKHEQGLASLAKTTSDTEEAIRINRTVVQALSSPLDSINQTFPLVKQQNEAMSITVKAVHDETRVARIEARNFQEKILEELTKIAKRVDSSPISLESTLAIALENDSVEMDQVKSDLQLAHSQKASALFARSEAIDQRIRCLQIGLISKPGLMQSVCEENHRSRSLSRVDIAQSDGPFEVRKAGGKRLQGCSCKLRCNGVDSETCFTNSHLALTSTAKWKITFETEFTRHHHMCPLFQGATDTNMARLRIKRCGTILAGAVEATIAITRGAGGLSISPTLRYARVIPLGSPVFELVSPHCVYALRRPISTSGRPISITPSELEASLDVSIREIVRLFHNGKASPCDVDIKGNTLLHAASGLLSDLWLFSKETRRPCFVLIVRFLRRLEELHVPLNWTNDHNLTFMNQFLFKTPHSTDPSILVTSASQLLDSGAELAKFPSAKPPRQMPIPIWMTKYIDSADLVDASEDDQIAIAIWNRSEQELDVALLNWPKVINYVNGLGSTSLHLAVGWTYGVQSLLQHGAYVDATDLNGHTPLYYAFYLGFPETVRLLIKADCSLQLVIARGWPNVLWDVSRDFRNDGFEVWGVSHQTRVEVQDTVIASLAERRCDLQDRLAHLRSAVEINPAIFRDDQILDEYAEYAECAEEEALREYDHIPLRASTLLVGSRTVYHIKNLRVDIAEKLWHNGFHDVDVSDEDGLTPLMLFRYGYGVDFANEIALCSWLLQKGAKLHRPQHDRLDHGPHPTLAIHYVAANIGYKACYLASFRFDGHAKQPLKDQLNQLSPQERLLLTTIFSNQSHDDCICACSTRGCLASTMMLKVSQKEYSDKPSRRWSTLATKYLTRFVRTPIYDMDWLVKEIIRYRTFTELDLRHTCCRWDAVNGIVKLDCEERVEIREEDEEKIELLESLLVEFEEKMGDQDFMSFLDGYWAVRMDKFLRERGCVDEEALRELGVVLRPDGIGSE